VTFDIDANSTLKVTAVENLTGKGNKITVNNYKRRLSKVEFEHMVNDEEYNRAEDGKKKQTLSAKNALQSYCYKILCAVEDVKLKGRISESDKNTILGKCNEVIR
jgi:L1 cell adhesion molecule like protein